MEEGDAIVECDEGEDERCEGFYKRMKRGRAGHVVSGQGGVGEIRTRRGEDWGSTRIGAELRLVEGSATGVEKGPDQGG